MGKLKNHTTELKLEEMQLIRRLRRHLPFQRKVKGNSFLRWGQLAM